MLKSLFGGPSVRLLNTRETEKAIHRIVDEAKEHLSLITPYASFGKLGTLRREVVDAVGRGVDVTVVVRDEPDQVNRAADDLHNAVISGLSLFKLERLHAKIYMNEYAAVIGSANLLEGSFDKSIELGVLIEDDGLYEDLIAFLDEKISPNMVSIEVNRISNPPSSFRRGKRGKVPRAPVGSGKCIRCRTEVRLDPARPYCREHFEAWAKYKNPEYTDKFCHRCGKDHPASLAKPLCGSCYRAA